MILDAKPHFQSFLLSFATLKPFLDASNWQFLLISRYSIIQGPQQSFNNSFYGQRSSCIEISIALYDDQTLETLENRLPFSKKSVTSLLVLGILENCVYGDKVWEFCSNVGL